MAKSEMAAMRDYATKHHSENVSFDDFCRKCDKINIHDYGRSIGAVRERAVCCNLCSSAAFAPRSFRG